MHQENIIDGLLDGRGFVKIEMVSPQILPWEDDGSSVHPERTRDYFIAKAARASTDGKMKLPKEDRRLIRYLIKNKHTSPLEMGNVTFLIKCPISISRQILRHRTGKFNEFSQRYSEVTEEMGRMRMDREELIRGQSKMNAQCSVDLPSEKIGEIKKKLESVEEKLDDIFKDYQECIRMGLTREAARFMLPQSTYTVLEMQMDLNNLMKFLTLRTAPDAQYEIRVFAEAMLKLTKRYFPVVMEVFEEELENVVLDRWAVKMIQERKIPEEVTSKSGRKNLEELATRLKIDLI